eukprot:ANDGO_01366.mRNA.1 hypothetical protein GUITHDRAFT_162008
MPPKKAAKKAGADGEKTPEDILNEFVKWYKKTCVNRKVDAIDAVLKQVKAALEKEDGAELVRRFTFFDVFSPAQLSALLECCNDTNVAHLSTALGIAGPSSTSLPEPEKGGSGGDKKKGGKGDGKEKEGKDKGGEGGAAAAGSGQTPGVYTELRSLHFWRCQLGDDGMHVLAEFLKMDTHLKGIDVLDCGISPRGCLFLSSCLGSGSKVNDTLTRLELDYNAALGDQGAITLAESFRINECNIDTLSLKFCGIGPKGALAIGECILGVYVRLKVLDLQGNPISTGLVGIADGLSRNTTIVELLLKDTLVGHDSAGIEALGRAVERNQSLEVLDLAYNELPAEAATALLESCKKHTVANSGWRSIQVSETLPKEVYAGFAAFGAKSKSKGKGGKGKGGKKKK